MKRYIFSLDKVLFESTTQVLYDEVEHKIINESIKEKSIVVLAEDIKIAKEKAINSLNEMILFEYGNLPRIDNYKFSIRIIKIEEI